MEYKTTLYVLLLVMILLMTKTVTTARQLRLAISGYIASSKEDLWRTHIIWASFLATITFYYIYLIESKRSLLATAAWDWLFVVHLTCALGYFFTMMALIVFAIIKRKEFRGYAKLGRTCAGFFIPTAFTGFFLINRMKI